MEAIKRIIIPCIYFSFEKETTPTYFNILTEQIQYAYTFSKNAYGNMACLSLAALGIENYAYNVLERVAGFLKEYRKYDIVLCHGLCNMSVGVIHNASNHKDVGNTNTSRETVTETNNKLITTNSSTDNPNLTSI